MKQVEKRARREFDSRHLHQKVFEIEVFVGGAMVSIDGLVGKWTTRKAMDVIQAKSVNAEKANTLGTVTVKASKGFRFGKVAANDSSVLLAA